MRAAAIALALAIPVQAPTLPAWLTEIDGAYEGEVANGGRLDPVRTSFFLRSGRVEGEYVIREPNRDQPGTLFDCTAPGERRLRCRWRDGYGDGTLEVQFAPGLGRFHGAWGPRNAAPALSWTGKRADVAS